MRAAGQPLATTEEQSFLVIELESSSVQHTIVILSRNAQSCSLPIKSELGQSSGHLDVPYLFAGLSVSMPSSRPRYDFALEKFSQPAFEARLYRRPSLRREPPLELLNAHRCRRMVRLVAIGSTSGD